MTIERPNADEFAPYYASYIGKVPDGDLVSILERQSAEYASALRGLGEALFRYSPGKWTVKEVVGHVADSERVFGYRAMRIARSDGTPLPGFDENEYVAHAGFNERSLTDLLDEFQHVRRGSIALFRSFSPEVAARRGTANGLVISARALAWLTAGHAAHHLGILREKYLV
jgi:hypothetical protein